MVFDPFKINLPIAEIIPQIRNHLAKENAIIIGAPPGAGKSTLLPPALMQEPWLKGQKIILLEPRRLAAISIASRISDLLNTKLGDAVGYRIRFDTKVSENTIIEVVTEGILTRILHSDNALTGVGMVVFDEFHERSLNADLALALCRETQQVLRPDLKIVVMSATLNIPKLSDLLGAKVIESQGRMFPVEIKHAGQIDAMVLPEIICATIVKAVSQHDGDVLVFLPGQAEILKCQTILQKKLNGFQIHPLYGILDRGKQFAAIMPNTKGLRKIVLATSIAETSLTIEGVKIVIDSGLGRTSKFDPNTGLTRLETVKISMDSALQRSGRAGRITQGVCYRMWSAADESRMALHRVPEILEADLCPLLLELAQWGAKEFSSLTWLDTPSKGAIEGAYQTLQQIGAIENKQITPHGKEIHAIAAHPRIAHMLLKAKEEGLLALACDLAAILEEKDPLDQQAGIDINLRIEALRRFRAKQGQKGKLGQIEKISSSYRKHFGIHPQEDMVNPFEVGLLIAHAFPDRIAFARPGNNAQFQLTSGALAMAGHKDDLAHQPWLAIAAMDARGGMGKIFLASPINPRDLMDRVEEKQNLLWDTKKGGLVASLDLKLGNITLQSKPIQNIDPLLKQEVICGAIEKEGKVLLNFSADVMGLINRILSCGVWADNNQWPNVHIDHLLKTNKEWLAPYLNEVKTVSDLKQLHLYDIIKHSLSFQQQQLLEKWAPKSIEVPSGSKIVLEYNHKGEPPILAVRIQELFGLGNNITIGPNKGKVKIHLLSPGYKPVQITDDIVGFWNGSYKEVKKQLKGRYPKHDWPENPQQAKAIRGAKPRSHKSD